MDGVLMLIKWNNLFGKYVNNWVFDYYVFLLFYILIVDI